MAKKNSDPMVRAMTAGICKDVFGYDPYDKSTPMEKAAAEVINMSKKLELAKDIIEADDSGDMSLREVLEGLGVLKGTKL